MCTFKGYNEFLQGETMKIDREILRRILTDHFPENLTVKELNSYICNVMNDCNAYGEDVEKGEDGMPFTGESDDEIIEGAQKAVENITPLDHPKIIYNASLVSALKNDQKTHLDHFGRRLNSTLI